MRKIGFFDGFSMDVVCFLWFWKGFSHDPLFFFFRNIFDLKTLECNTYSVQDGRIYALTNLNFQCRFANFVQTIPLQVFFTYRSYKALNLRVCSTSMFHNLPKTPSTWAMCEKFSVAAEYHIPKHEPSGRMKVDCIVQCCGWLTIVYIHMIRL